MANTLARGGFVVSVELIPPRGFQADALIEQARRLKERGVDLVNIPDIPRASARMSALSAALLVQQQSGVETILHYVCRDRNLLGMQSDLLGAHAMGMRNVLLVTGDPPKVGDYPDATAVPEVDSIGLANLVSSLNGGADIGGQPIGSPTAFHIGVAVNQGALNLDEELRRFAYKVEAGAEFAITQPVFDAAEFRDVRRAGPARTRFRSWRASCPSRARATPSSWPTRCPACASPRPSSSGCAARTRTAAPPRRAWPSRAKSWPKSAPWCRVSNFDRPRGPSRRLWAIEAFLAPVQAKGI